MKYERCLANSENWYPHLSPTHGKKINIGLVWASPNYFIKALTGFACTSSWLLATADNQMMVITEFRTKEKKRFLWRVIL